jgi:hypothetical protein
MAGTARIRIASTGPASTRPASTAPSGSTAEISLVLSRSCTYQPGRYSATLAMMASASAGTISSSRRASRRSAMTRAIAASATPARCSTLNIRFTG